MAELSFYRVSQGGLFCRDFVWEASKTCPPWIWWKGILGSTQLSKVAERLLSLPATTAATERSFSTHDMIHTKARNKLTTERASKLVYVRHNLKILNAADINELNDKEESINDSDKLSVCSVTSVVSSNIDNIV